LVFRSTKQIWSDYRTKLWLKSRNDERTKGRKSAFSAISAPHRLRNKLRLKIQSFPPAREPELRSKIPYPSGFHDTADFNAAIRVLVRMAHSNKAFWGICPRQIATGATSPEAVGGERRNARAQVVKRFHVDSSV